MSFTLRYAIENTPLKNAKLIAGMQGLDREISAVNIVEVPEVSHWMHGGELLFSAGFAFGGDDQRGCELISGLNQHGIAALAIKPGKYLKSIPQSMIDHAEQLGFPLLELPPDCPYSDFMDPIYTMLLNNRVTFLENVTNLHECLLQSIMDGNLTEFFNVLSANLKKPIYYLDQKGNIILSAGAISDIYEVQQAFYNSLELRLNWSIGTQKWHHQLFDGHHEFLCIPVFVHTSVQAYLVAELLNYEPSEADTIGLKYASTLVALELMKRNALIEKEHQLRGELLNDLLGKHYEADEVIYRRGEIIRFDLHLPYVVFSVRFIMTSSIQKADYSRESERIKKDFHSIATQFSSNKHVNMMLLVKSDSIIGMFSLSEEKKLRPYTALLQRVTHELKKQYPFIRIVIGLGRINTGLDNIPVSYSEAELAVHIAQQIPKLGNITDFENLGIYRILCELKDSPAMMKFYFENMKPLLEYDQDNDIELVKTIESYFENNCNLRKTADALFMHKNSIAFRIRKAELLLGKSLSDPDNALRLQLCLKFKKML